MKQQNNKTQPINTNPTIDEVVESLKSVIEPIEGIDIEGIDNEGQNEKAAIVLAVDDNDILLFGAGTVTMQATLIAALLKRQPILMLALKDM